MAKKMTLESYYQTDNDWHNEHIIKLIASIREKGLFTDVLPALELYNFALEGFLKEVKAPLKVIEAVEQAAHKLKLEAGQVLYILEEITAYIDRTDWETDGIEDQDRDNFVKLFKAEIVYRKNLLNKDIPPKPEVKNLRQDLKAILQNELQNLPEYLERLEPKDKLNFICKLMPFVLPKVLSIQAEKGESKFEEMSFWQ